MVDASYFSTEWMQCFTTSWTDDTGGKHPSAAQLQEMAADGYSTETHHPPRRYCLGNGESDKVWWFANRRNEDGDSEEESTVRAEKRHYGGGEKKEKG